MDPSHEPIPEPHQVQSPSARRLGIAATLVLVAIALGLELVALDAALSDGELAIIPLVAGAVVGGLSATPAVLSGWMASSPLVVFPLMVLPDLVAIAAVASWALHSVA